MPVSLFGERVIDFNTQLHFKGKIPLPYSVLNPFLENPETLKVMQAFYQKYYADNKRRRMILGINPGRHGAAVTGVPFTDTKRLRDVCGIHMLSAHTHEVSSVFVYDMIAAYGGPEKFFSDFYINSPFPLAIVREKNGKSVNANYYDDKELFGAVRRFMIKSLQDHIALGIDTSVAYVMGIKNARFIHQLNEEAKLFDTLIPLEHPRFIQQYKSKEQDKYIAAYLEAFASGSGEG